MDSVLSIREAPTKKSCWVVDLEKEAMSTDSSIEAAQWKHSIYRVPSYIKDLNPKAYQPQIISFGPFHHGQQQVAPMEEHKRRSLRHFLRRSSTRSDKSLQDYVDALTGVVDKLMAAYEGLEEEWKNNRERFIEIMILDGCFMLEFMQTFLHENNLHDYASNDPVFSPHGALNVVPHIKRDMLMIENQLPLLVLYKLYAIETGKPPNDVDREINSLVVAFCGFDEKIIPANMALGLHPVDVYRTCLVDQVCRISTPKEPTPRSSSTDYIRSATELHEAGIRFRKSNTNSPRDIHFNHGKLELPTIEVDDATEYLYLNLMAFERLHMVTKNEVSAYVFLMDNIIDHPRDVSLLKSKGIIQNALGSDEPVAALFSSLSKGVVVHPESHLAELHRSVNGYCENKYHSWRANLIHTYFRSPWSVISLIAAIFLLAMTAVQTFYSVYTVYNKNNP